MTSPPDDLTRFIIAQEGAHERALEELQTGRKTSHWMWFIFPQLRGLGHSETARFYGLRDLAEARDYINHPVLGARLRACATALLAHKHRSAREILGTPDDLKLCSCMTLFMYATEEPNSVVHDVLAHFYNGREDARTVELLNVRSR